MKYKIEKLLGIKLSHMKKEEIINVTVEELFNISDTLFIRGFWYGVGLTSIFLLGGILIITYL